MKKFSFLALLIWGQSFAQEITVRQGQGLKDKDTVHFMDFMDVSLAKFEFEGPELMGKSPTVLVKELRDGKVLRIDTLLNGDAPYLKISKAQYGLSFFTEIRDEVLRTFMRSEKYGAGKRKFVLDKDLYGYALKDFFGAKQELRYKVGEQIPLLAVITR
mgnify:CR=1 FL=1